jgi:hypothetical protein
VGRQSLRDADHGLDPGVDRLVDRVGREPRRDEHHRRVRVDLVDRLRDGVEDRDPLDVLPTLARRDPGDDLRAVVAVADAVERALAARQALDDEPSLVVDDDRQPTAPSYIFPRLRSGRA